MDTRPATVNMRAGVYGLPLWKAAKISKKPPTSAQAATTITSTSAVGPGHDQGDHARGQRRPAPSSRWPKTGPAVRLLKASHRLQPGGR